MTDVIKVVRQFTEAIGCTTDRYNVRQTALYIGLQTEEMCEKVDALIEGISLEPDADVSGVMRLMHLRDILHDVSQGMKVGEFDKAVELADRAAMLDADIDLAWVTIGSALSQGADVEGAAGEVARANLAKLVECSCGNGKHHFSDERGLVDCGVCNGLGLVAIKDANGKVKKPGGWTSPNIAPFVCKESANG